MDTTRHTAAPDLSNFDWIVINTSAGKDSQAMLSYVVDLCRAQGVSTSKVVAVHADLGRVEWQGVRDLAGLQAALVGVRFEVVKRGQDLLDHVAERGMWPSNTARFCTSDHKRDQVAKLFTRLAKEKASLGRQVRILSCMGLRAEESPNRAKLQTLKENKRASSGRRLVVDWLPIHDWTHLDVWARIFASQLPYHFAYDIGMPRLSCCFCIFASKGALAIAARHNPELLGEYMKVEAKTGHLFKDGWSIAELNRRDVDFGPAEFSKCL